MSYGRRWDGCQQPRRIVYPVRHDFVNRCTEEVVEHIHPSHTTVCNHHIVQNRHVFPHTTSQEFSVEEVNITDPGYPGHYGPGHYGKAPCGGGYGKRRHRRW